MIKMVSSSLCVLGMVLILTTLTTGCGSRTERPESVAVATRPPGYIFKSLPKLVATSEIVVIGTVKSAGRGERVVPDDTLYYRDVVVDVQRQFYGEPVESNIFFHQDGYEGDTPFEISGVPWVYQGDRVILFLADPPGPPSNHYNIIAPPGLLIVGDDGTITTEATDPVARSLNGQQWSVVAPRIRESAQVVRNKDIKPLPPGPFGKLE